MPSSYHSSIIVILSLGVYQQVLLRDCNIYKTQLRKSSARHNITPVLQQLHWLPVQSRIDFKTLILNQRGGSFSYNGPKLWNALPAFIRNAASLDCFKKLLKTHLFSKAFNL